MRKVVVLHICIGLTGTVWAQQGQENLRKGNDFYRQSQFHLAEKEYRAALKEAPENSIAQYNLALALYRQKKMAAAATAFHSVKAEDGDKKAAVHYNTGVIHTKEKALEASIEAYKAALRLKPDDQQARENLQKALMELKKKQQEQKQQQKQKQPQSNLSKKEAEQKLKLLQDKERKLQERLQNKNQKGGALPKDW